MNEEWILIQDKGDSYMLTAFKALSKDDIQGFMLIPVILLMCAYHEELAELIGIILRCFFAALD